MARSDAHRAQQVRLARAANLRRKSGPAVRGRCPKSAAKLRRTIGPRPASRGPARGWRLGLRSWRRASACEKPTAVRGLTRVGSARVRAMFPASRFRNGMGSLARIRPAPASMTLLRRVAATERLCNTLGSVLPAISRNCSWTRGLDSLHGKRRALAVRLPVRLGEPGPVGHRARQARLSRTGGGREGPSARKAGLPCRTTTPASCRSGLLRFLAGFGARGERFLSFLEALHHDEERGHEQHREAG